MKRFKYLFILILLSCLFYGCTEHKPGSVSYLAGDFHQHTTFTDGSWSLPYMMNINSYYKLDWWANSEHGGSNIRNGLLSGADVDGGKDVFWTPDSVKGKTECTIGSDNQYHRKMWRWQSIRDFSFAGVIEARTRYPDKIIFQGVEWNVPGHEHASVCIVGNEFNALPDAAAIAEFEYKFDDCDTDDSDANGWIKNRDSGHAKTLEAIAWLKLNYKNSAWVIPAHPERKGKYVIADFRDMNNACPEVCFGFESMPGHQKAPERGEYSRKSNTSGDCTYGGTGIMAAKVGGVWDALLSEGRHWWLFANSDFHDTINDFYPGEYERTYVGVKRKDAQSIVDGMRSGNVFVVQGNLIDQLGFSIGNCSMGECYHAKNRSIWIKIKIHDNDNLDHVDIIEGRVRGLIPPSSAEYSVDTVETTCVMARFDSVGGVVDLEGVKSTKWKALGNGYKEMSFKVKNVTSNLYFRLRGTNLGISVPLQTDGNGNPLADTLMQVNNAGKAKEDLWFYSNPIWVEAKTSFINLNF